MKLSYFGTAALAAALLAGTAKAAPTVTGDYLESRSANVFVGACHHEGEVVSTGRDAVLAWNVTGGEHNGVSLKGVTALAVVSADRHLDVEGVVKKSVLYVSESASPEQREAFAALVKERAAGATGPIVAVKTTPISFDSRGDQLRVQANGVALVKVRKTTGELCCKQPYEVWGKPGVPVKAVKAGYCLGMEVKEASFQKTWSVADQNNSFFGQFSL